MTSVTTVIGVMKIGNISPKAGIEQISLASYASVLTMSPPRISDVTTVPMPTTLCNVLPEWSVQTTTLVPLEL